MRSACPWPWKISNSRLAQGGAVFGGGKGGSGGTTYQTQTTTIPPEVRARYDAVNARAEQVAQTPFRPYDGQFVAPINQTQQTAINQIGQAGQGYQPYQQAATGALTGAGAEAYPYYGMASQSLTGGLQAAVPMLGQAAGNIDQAQAAGAPYTGMATLAGLAGTQAVNPAQLDIGRYMDPYLQSVVQPTMQGLYQQQQQQQSQLMGQQAMRGAFGGDRGAIAAANLARQQGLGAAQAQSQLLSQGYQQALAAAQQQQGVGLGAAQANRQAFQQFAPQALAIGQQAFQQPMAAAQAQQGLGQAAFGMGQGMAQGQLGIGQGLLGYGQGMASGLAGLGQQGLQSQLAAGQALLGAGTLEQQTQQQLNSALYNQYLQQQGYPFQVAQFLANIALGTGPLYGSTQTGVTGQPTPFFSDERLKEDIREIGRTHDGQRIIKFRYKGEPPGTTHIGLSAQDVEQHHPEAVSETPEGIKAVDYDAATRHSEMAAGGVPVPGMNPGAAETAQGLAPWSAGLHKPENGPRGLFAAGGTPGVDPTSQQILDTLNPMSKTLPHGSFGSLPGKGGAWSPKLAVKSPGLKPPPLPAPPAQGKTGLGQAMDTAKDAVGLYGTGEKLVEGGQKAYDWFKKQADRQPGGASPDGATTKPGAITRTELAPPAESTPTPPPAPTQTSGLGAAAPTQQMTEATGLAPAVEEAPTMMADASDLGLDALSFAARGGRIHRAGGGSMPTDLPYSDAEGEYVPEKLTDTEPTPKLDEPKMQMHQQGGGQQKDKTASGVLGLAGLGASFIPGVGPFLGAGLKAASMFAARGGAVDIEHAKKLISGVESGGRYDALGPYVPGQGRAHGKYQIMPANIGPWTEAALGRRMTPEEFLKSPEAQERVFEHRFGSYLDKHGNLADAASMWHSGVPLAEARRQGRRDVNMSTEDYVRKIMGGAPPAEMHMRETPRAAGLAPSVTDVVDLNEVEQPEMVDEPSPYDRYAAGGLVPRKGYDVGGSPDAPYTGLTSIGDQLDPDAFAALTDEINSRKPPAPVSVARSAARGDDMTGPYPLVAETPPAAPPARTGIAPPTPQTSPGIVPPGGLAPPPPIGKTDEPAQASGLPQLPPDKKDEPGFFGKNGWFDRNQSWVMPAVEGVGKMLASRSPFLGNAIGEGLVAGAQAYPAWMFKQQGLDISQQNADTSSMSQLMRTYEYMQRIADVERASNNGQLSAATASNLAEIQKKIMAFAGMGSPRSAATQGTAPRPGVPTGGNGMPATGDQPRVGAPVAGGTAAPTGTGASPAYPDTPRTPITANYEMTEDGVPVDKMNNPAYLRSIADRMVTPDERNRYIEMAKRIEDTGQVRDINGRLTIAKGWPEMKRQQNAVAINQGWQQKEAAASNERQSLIRTYGILEKALQVVDTNPLAPATTQIKEAARALGFVVPEGMTSAAAVQEITKQVAARAAQAGSDLGRTLSQEGNIEAIKNPEANKQILAQLYADLDAAESRYKFIDQKIRENPTGDSSKWQQEWARDNPANKFQEDAYNRLGVLGATPVDDAGKPDPARMKVGATYLLTPDQYWRAMDGKVPRNAITGNVRVKIVEQNGQKGMVVQ